MYGCEEYIYKERKILVCLHEFKYMKDFCETSKKSLLSVPNITFREYLPLGCGWSDQSKIPCLANRNLFHGPERKLTLFIQSHSSGHGYCRKNYIPEIKSVLTVITELSGFHVGTKDYSVFFLCGEHRPEFWHVMRTIIWIPVKGQKFSS